MVRHRFCATDNKRDPLHCVWCGRTVQNRILAEACASSCNCLKTLAEWRQAAMYNKSDDWVFAGKPYRGRKPIWGQAILRKYVRPAAQRVGIQKRFGWHTFRHTYSTLLRSVGTEFKVMQELLRHSSFRSTLDVYTQAISPAKHAAQAAVLALVFSAETNATAPA
jgi:site-specific recombinase XerD